MSKQLTLIFRHFEKEHLGKDVFLVPYTIGKKYGYDVTIVYPKTATNADFPEQIRGVKLHPINQDHRFKWLPFWRTFPFYWYLLKNARKMDLFMRFHVNKHTFYQTLLYKFLNKKGKVYVKCDGLPNHLRLALGHSSYLSWKRRMKFNMLVNRVDRFSIETSADYNYMIRCRNQEFIEKLRLLPNGFDEEELQNLRIKERDFPEKKNLIITVGRLGTFEKNTEIILDSLDGIDMKNWEMRLIGPIEDSFKPKIEEFYMRNPEKRNSVVFMGSIYDKADLWNQYTEAKVFVLSSRWESFALVLGEAWRFKCYILSTNVGAAKDLTNSGQFGHVINSCDRKALQKAILAIIEGKTNTDVYNNADLKSISWHKLIESLDLDEIINKNA